MQQWSARVAGIAEGIGVLLALGAATAVGFRSGSALSGAAVFLLSFAAVTILAALLRVLLGVLESTCRGAGRLFSAPRPDPLGAWPTLRTSQGVVAPGRPVAFHVPGEQHAPPPPLTATDQIADLARRAVDTVDLLTRQTLFAGDEAFLCLGENRTCGAAFPADLRDDLKLHYGDKCPACGTVGAFTTVTLPDAAGTTSGPPPLPADALIQGAPAPTRVEVAAAQAVPADAAPPAPPPDPRPPQAAEVVQGGRRPLVFRTAS